MVCKICGKENSSEYQDFCQQLGCSGRMINPEKIRIRIRDLHIDDISGTYKIVHIFYPENIFGSHYKYSMARQLAECYRLKQKIPLYYRI